MNCKFCNKILSDISGFLPEERNKDTTVQLMCKNCEKEYYVYFKDDQYFYEHAKFILKNRQFIIRNLFDQNKCIIEIENVLYDNYFEFDSYMKIELKEFCIDFNSPNFFDKIEIYAMLT